MAKAFSAEQMLAYLKESESGTPIQTICSKYGVTDDQLRRWRKKLGRPNVAVANRWARQQDATRSLIQRSIDVVLQMKEPITLEAIRRASSTISADRRPLSASTLLRYRDLIVERGGAPTLHRDPTAPSVKHDGWSQAQHLSNLDRTRADAFSAIASSIQTKGRFPSPRELCIAVGYAPSSKADVRFRVHLREFMIDELKKLENDGTLSSDQILRSLSGSDSFGDPDALNAKIVWLCDYVVNNASLPLTNANFNSVANLPHGNNTPSHNWSRSIKAYRLSRLEDAFDQLTRIPADSIVAGTSKDAHSLIQTIDRLLAHRVPTPTDVLPVALINSVCDHILGTRKVVPTYRDLQEVLPFIPATNTTGHGYMPLLRSWRRSRGLPESLRGGMDGTVPRSWEQLIPELPEPLRSAPHTFLDPRASPGRFPRPHDEVATQIGKCKDPNVRAVLALGVLAGARNEKSFPGFVLGLRDVIAAASLTGPTDPRMEQALKDLVAGNLDLQYSPDDTGDEEDEEDAAANEDAEKNGDEDGGWTNNRLMHFFNVYRSLAFAHQKYLKQLSPSLHSAFSPFILPQLRDEVFWRASSFSRIAAEAQRRWRKSRTDSLFPRFGEIRTICEFRTNQADRIRTAFDSLVTKAAHNDLELPHRFTITEPASPFGPATDHKFTLWSRLSIGKAYRSAGRWTNENSRNHRGMANDYFLEYDGGQVIGAVSPSPDLWFADLLRYNLCHKDSIRTKATYDVLRSYGIPRNQYNKLSATLSGGRGLSAAFHDLIREVRARDSNFHPVYFHPHGLYTICLAGRLAVRIICVTTCRANELQQIFAGEDCLLKVDLTTLNRPAFAFMAIPKLRNEPEPFFIDERCLKFLREQLQWIALNSPNGVVPAIVGGKNLARHKRQHPRPYAFQFPRERPVAMRAGTIGSVVRFMLHGMMFRTTEGKPFQPGLHDLRHVTAAAYRSQDVPLPIIAKMMKQKDFRVTDYYSEPTSTQVVSAMQGLQVATVGNGAPDGVRMPDELERQLAEADGKVGALSNVLGGKCGCGTECAARFACLGCGAHIPDHREEDKVREIRSRRLSDRDFYASLGALAEVRKCESDIRDCDRVLEEMRLQKLAEADSKRTPDVKSLSEAPVRFWPKGTT